MDSFSRAAVKYDGYAEFQKSSAIDLIALLPKGKSFHSIIDIGAGTGFVSAELAKFFPEANYCLLDSSKEMLAVAHDKLPSASRIVSDAECYDFSDGVYDLGVSNLALHWFKSPEVFLKKIMSHSRYFLFSTMLNSSFTEYKQAFLKNGFKPPTFCYPELQEFIIPERIIALDKKRYVKSFINLHAAARHFKNIGAGRSSYQMKTSKLIRTLKSSTAPITLNYEVLFMLLKGER